MKSRIILERSHSWSSALVSKTNDSDRGPWVRIPPSPPRISCHVSVRVSEHDIRDGNVAVAFSTSLGEKNIRDAIKEISAQAGVLFFDSVFNR